MDPMDARIKEHLERARGARHLPYDLDEAEAEKVPASLLTKVKRLFPEPGKLSCPHCSQPLTPFKTPLSGQKIKNTVWAVLAVAAFASSFLAPKYFLQFLAAFLFFGFRWIVDQKATKTQIFIYKTLRESESSEVKGRDLHHPSSHL